MSDLNNESIESVINKKTTLLSEDKSEFSNYNTIDDTPEVVCEGYENNDASKNKLIKVIFVSTFFFLLELTGGLVSGSLALLSDSFHLLSGKYFYIFFYSLLKHNYIFGF